MNRRFNFVILLMACVVLVPFRSPAPLIYTPGEGWTYEAVGSEGKWRRVRAKDQLEVAQQAFKLEDYNLAIKAGRRVVTTWPLSDFAPEAQYIVGRSYEAKKNDERAFKEYQKILEKYPKNDNANDVLQRQYEIALRFLNGQWFKLWGVVPIFPSMDKTATMFEKIVKNGPYSSVGPQAQLRIGAAREKQRHYPDAVKAYERAADRYHDRPIVAADALYQAGVAYQKQAATAEYDQSMAGKAIQTFTDFITLYPDDKRVPEAQKTITLLRSEQARGNFSIAGYYEKRARRGSGDRRADGYNPWLAPLVYYNEVLIQDPDSTYAAEARKRIDAIKKQMQTASK